MLDLLLFFTVSTKFCSPVFLSSHKTTQFSFMCPLGDPNSGSSGMCVCVCVGGAGMRPLECLSVCVRQCLGQCVVTEVYERGAQHI